jgi:branched-chain amino acid transport system substrate-binding protein
MKLRGLLVLGTALAAIVAAQPSLAQAPVKIGMITTLSGPGGYIGEDVRDAFMLAMEEEKGKLGGIPVNLMVEDDGLKPGQGKQIAQKFLTSDKAKILTGIIFSNVAGAVVPDVVDADAFYISPNAGPSNLAGKECNKNYFVVSWQNDTLHESAGQNATNLGFKKMFVLAPNYQAGKDAITGFKRFYKGEIAGELYTSLDQTDYAAELAQIRAAKPDGIFQFLPGALGITFLKQYAQSGMSGTTKMVVAAPSADARIIGAVGDAALGVNVSAHWNADFDNAANKKFVAGFRAKYNRMPTFYASQGYDTAKLIASGLKAVKGDMSKADAFRTELRKADFQSVRGGFKFGPNQHPIQDWYSLRIEKDAAGTMSLKTTGKVLTNRGDAYSKDCKL